MSVFARQTGINMQKKKTQGYESTSVLSIRELARGEERETSPWRNPCVLMLGSPPCSPKVVEPDLPKLALRSGSNEVEPPQVRKQVGFTADTNGDSVDGDDGGDGDDDGSSGRTSSSWQSWLVTALALVLVSAPFWAVPLFCAKQFGHPADDSTTDSSTDDAHHRRLGAGASRYCTQKLPFYLGVSYTLLGAWVMGRVADAIYLPPVLGFLIAGFCFQYFNDETTQSAAPYIQTLSFLIVLVRAGLEIELSDINRVTLPLGCLPVLVDGFTIAIMATYTLDFTFTEAGSLAFILASLGDGLVIPLMLELKPLKLGPMPRLMFTAAPLEACTALFTFGVFEGFAAADAHDQPAWAVVVLSIFVKMIATLVFAFVLAYLFVFIVEERGRFTVFGKPFFTCQPQEELLFVCAAAILAYGLADDETVVISNGYGGSLLNKDLAVVGVAVFYSALRPSSLHDLEHMFASIWVFGSLFLFVNLGAQIETSSFAHIGRVLPLLLAGLVGRFFTYGAVLFFTIPARQLHERHARANFIYEWGFAMVASIPRATIQGALAAIPGTEVDHTHAILVDHTPAIHTLYTHCTLTVHSLYTRYTPTIHSLYTHCTILTIQSLYTHCTLTIHPLSTHCTSAIHP
jgi:hypothetical protein